MKKPTIPFNHPYLPQAMEHLGCAIHRRQVSGNGFYTGKCQEYFNSMYQAETLLTTSCTDALEMSALLAQIKPGDEVIMPSFTFTSTANAFVLRGGKVVFADTTEAYPNLDTETLEELITHRTKAIICMHYAGVACDMERLTELAIRHQLLLIEDAAQAIAACYRDQLLGTFGRFATLSFHETKNITAGEGGLLILNDTQDIDRAHILWEKGTDRVAFHRHRRSKYEWRDVGSSFLTSELNAAVLYGQLNQIEEIQERRIRIWNHYNEGLKPLESEGWIRLPDIPDFASINGHLFFMECDTSDTRDQLIRHLSDKGVQAVFHYLPLHQSPFYRDRHDGRDLPHTIRFSDCLIRLPLYYELKQDEQDYIIECIYQFFKCTSI